MLFLNVYVLARYARGAVCPFMYRRFKNEIDEY